MDIREKNKQNLSNEPQKRIVNEQELNDSLIYNIMKKIELREQLINEYTKQKQETNKHWLTKHYIHGQMPIYYGGFIALSKLIRIIYMKPGASAGPLFSIPNTLFHICIFVSLNEYQKYRNIFYLRHQLGEEYRIYQKNVDNLMDQKMSRFSLLKKLSQSNMLNQDYLMSTLKYRMVF